MPKTDLFDNTIFEDLTDDEFLNKNGGAIEQEHEKSEGYLSSILSQFKAKLMPDKTGKNFE